MLVYNLIMGSVIGACALTGQAVMMWYFYQQYRNGRRDR